LSSDVDEVCRNAAWVLSCGALSGEVALEACSIGALEALMKLSSSDRKSSSKFASDALEKILNYRKFSFNSRSSSKVLALWVSIS
jgi:hypothetical protein